MVSVKRHGQLAYIGGSFMSQLFIVQTKRTKCLIFVKMGGGCNMPDFYVFCQQNFHTSKSDLFS